MCIRDSFIDGVDGSLARRVDVKKYTPNINGENLDNIIDYLNYVFLPAFVIYWLDLVPEGMALISVATILIVSCYTFANNSIKTSDLYFSGFPALWNVVILYFYILDTDPFTNLLVIFALSFLTFIPLKYIHPFRVKQFRKSTLSILMLWMITTVLLLYFNYLDETVLRIAFLFWSLTNVYFIFLTILRSLRK